MPISTTVLENRGSTAGNTEIQAQLSNLSIDIKRESPAL